MNQKPKRPRIIRKRKPIPEYSTDKPTPKPKSDEKKEK